MRDSTHRCDSCGGIGWTKTAFFDGEHTTLKKRLPEKPF